MVVNAKQKGELERPAEPPPGGLTFANLLLATGAKRPRETGESLTGKVTFRQGWVREQARKTINGLEKRTLDIDDLNALLFRDGLSLGTPTASNKRFLTRAGQLHRDGRITSVSVQVRAHRQGMSSLQRLGGAFSEECLVCA